MKFRTVATAILLGIACTLLAKADTLIVAKEFEATDAPTSVLVLGERFHAHFLYHSDYFVESMPEGALITGIALRSDKSSARIDGQAGLSLALSTSPVTPPFINREFSKNIGSDALTVFQGTVSWLDTGPTADAKPFSIRLAFQTPFYYNPRAGNLLLDFSSVFGPFSYGMDAFANDRVVAVVGGTSTTIGTLGGRLGPVIELTYTPVPEPSTTMLCLAVLLLHLLGRRGK